MLNNMKRILPTLNSLVKNVSNYSVDRHKNETSPVPDALPDRVRRHSEHPAVNTNTQYEKAYVNGFGYVLTPAVSGILPPSDALDQALQVSRQRIKDLLKTSEFRLDNFLKRHALPDRMHLTEDGQHVIAYRSDKVIHSIDAANSVKEKWTHPAQLPDVQSIENATQAFIQSVSKNGVLDERALEALITRHQAEVTPNLISVSWDKDTAEIIATNTEPKLDLMRAAVMRGSPGHVVVYKIPVDEIILPRAQQMQEFEGLVTVAIPPSWRSTCYVHPPLSVMESPPEALDVGNLTEHLSKQSNPKS